MRPNLARLRAIQTAAIASGSKVCTIQRPNRLADTHGGVKESLTTVGSGVACTLGAPSNQRELLLAQKLTTQASWYVSLPYGTGVQSGDRLTIDGKVYRVLYLEGGSFSTAVRCVVVDNG
jgi:hypothetical protein